MTAQQKYLLYFLSGLVLLTVVAVLAANFGLGGDASRPLAKWGQVAVLGEIVALFVLIGRRMFVSRARPLSLVITEPPRLRGYIRRIAWDQQKCHLVHNGRSFPVRPALSPVAPSIEIKLPPELTEQIKDHEPVELKLTDTKGNRWEVRPFFLFQQQRPLEPITVVREIVSSYREGELEEEDEDE